MTLEIVGETRLPEIAGVPFSLEMVKVERLTRFLKPTLIQLKGQEKPSSMFKGLTPQEIVNISGETLADGYYEFTKISGWLVINGTERTRFINEIQRSPTTFFGGLIVELSILEGSKWRNLVKPYLDQGFTRGVFFKVTQEKPYMERLYPLGPHDKVLNTVQTK